jgi:hypothetical protein
VNNGGLWVPYAIVTIGTWFHAPPLVNWKAGWIRNVFLCFSFLCMRLGLLLPTKLRKKRNRFDFIFSFSFFFTSPIPLLFVVVLMIEDGKIMTGELVRD